MRYRAFLAGLTAWVLVALAAFGAFAQGGMGPGPGTVHSAGVASTTWNPADQAGGSTSPGDLVWNYAGGGTDGGIRSIGSTSSNKRYFEISGTIAGANAGIGLANSSAVLTTAGNTANDVAALYTSGNFWVAGSQVLAGATASWSGVASTIGVAVDFPNKLIWFTLNGSTWSNSGNPAAGTGGMSFSTLTGAYFAMSLGNAGNNAAFTANFGASAFLYSVPGNGFTGVFP